MDLSDPPPLPSERLLLQRPDHADVDAMLGERHWGKGFATEAGRAILGYAFGTLCLPEVVSGCLRRQRAVRARAREARGPCDQHVRAVVHGAGEGTAAP